MKKNTHILQPKMMEKRKQSAYVGAACAHVNSVPEINQMLDKSAIRNSIILHILRDGLSVMSADGKFLDVNPAFCNMVGYTKQELLKMGINDLAKLRTPAEIKKRIRTIMAKGYHRFETKFCRKDGIFIDVEVSAQYLDSGKTEIFFSLFRDITANKLNERWLGRFKTIADIAPIGFAITDSGGNFIYTNDRFANKHGYKPKELIGKNLLILCPREKVKCFHDCMQKILKTREGREAYESWHLRRNGTEFPALMHAWPLYEEGGNAPLICIAAIDMSETKKLELELHRYKEHIVRVRRAAYMYSIGTLITHTLSQPLAVINMLLQESLKDLKNGSFVRESIIENLSDGLKEVNNTMSLIHKFRQKSGKLFDDMDGKVNIAKVLDKIVKVLDESAKSAKIDLVTEGINNLPFVRSNEMATEQVLFIIIQNAIDAADGKKWHKLVMSGEVKESVVRLYFADDCCGIDSKHLKRIFEPFFTTKPIDKGTGLGLPLVRHIIESCGREIQVKSRLGRGTTFTITLPVYGDVSR